MNRKERRAARHSDKQPPPGVTAGRALAEAVTAQFRVAMAHHQSGAFSEAEHCYRQILAVSPAHAETYSRLGAAIMSQGRIGEAIAAIERAIALNPELFEAHGNLAQAYTWTGQREGAIEAACRAIELKETAQSRAMFAQCVAFARFTTDNGRFRRLLLRALSDGWGRPRELTAACISLIKLDRVVNEGIARTDSAWPVRLSAAELLGASAMTPLAQDQLLCRVLECDPIADIALERFLTNVRYAMLTAAPDAVDDETLLGFYCAMARQCFVNEYVFSITDAEAGQAAQLRASLEKALADGTPCPPSWPAIVGAYFPLHLVAKADGLLERSWPQCVSELLVQQIKEPAEEHRIAANMPVLTELDGEVSRLVREQYEENPYPRWARVGTPVQPPLPAGPQARQAVDALIAGCGTGLSTIEFAGRARNARVLAIDLSLGSLSYAKRMARTLGVANIEFAQADIMRLVSIERTFDFIDASGVLHHLADPWEGWRVLLSLLRPGGVMQVGLYSELARGNVVEARALIGQRGWRPIPEDIRRCRDEIAAAADGSPLKSLTLVGDFFTTGECRDLLFHPQEHRLTLPDIKAFLAANDLQFAGFVLPPPMLQKFAARFPERTAMLDLDCWHAFETEVPDVFAGMYLFSVQKAAPARGP